MTEDARLQAKTLDFARKNGRRPRVLLAELGENKNTRNIKIMALGFANAGFDVDISPPGKDLKRIAKMAVENDVHCVGLINFFNGSEPVSDLVHLLKQDGADDIAVFTGTQKLNDGAPACEDMVNKYVTKTLSRICVS